MARNIVSFSMRLAEKVGFENAGFLQDIAYWIDCNKSSDVNFVDGRYWSFSTQEELCKRHPYWTRKQIQRIIKNCKENGWLLVENYNKSQYDRTNWYSLSDEIMELIFGCNGTFCEVQSSAPNGAMSMPETGHSNNVYKNDKKNDNIKSSFATQSGKNQNNPVVIPSQKETGFSDTMQEAFVDWLTYKYTEKKFVYKEVSMKSLISEIKNNIQTHGEQIVIRTIQRTISNGWQGIAWNCCQQIKEEIKQKRKEENAIPF